MTDEGVTLRVDRIERQIIFIRGQKVMTDMALADLYEVEVRALNQAVSRNIERFPADFMFRLTVEEAKSLRSQSVILKTQRGQHRKYLPHAQFKVVFDAIRELMTPPEGKKRPIGFTS